jgi:outer membrane protein with beta-barrel domain
MRHLLAFLLVAGAAPAAAQTVQLAPFGGFQFGGALSSPVYEEAFSMKSSFSYGGTVDIAINEGWRFEMLYSRQDTTLRPSGGPGPTFDLAVERYLVGIEEEKGQGEKTKPFGVFLLGATRFVPGLNGYGSDTRFTIGLALGVKLMTSKNFGFRFEGRGYFTPVNSSASLVCINGACLFGASGNGFWQGDLSGSVVFGF